MYQQGQLNLSICPLKISLLWNKNKTFVCLYICLLIQFHERCELCSNSKTLFLLRWLLSWGVHSLLLPVASQSTCQGFWTHFSGIWVPLPLGQSWPGLLGHVIVSSLVTGAFWNKSFPRKPVWSWPLMNWLLYTIIISSSFVCVVAQRFILAFVCLLVITTDVYLLGVTCQTSRIPDVYIIIYHRSKIAVMKEQRK